MADTGVNATAAALLGLLHEGPMTGGQLMAAAERRFGSYWSMTRSQVYRELPALAAEPGREIVRNPVALRAAFGRYQSGTQLRNAYQQATDWHTAALAEARETARELKKEGDPHAAAALEFAVGYHKAALSWLKTAPTR
jgi:hypothetical protein